MRRIFIVASGFLVVVILGQLSLTWFVGQRLLAPVPRVIGQPPSDFPAKNVSVESGSGHRLAGWLTLTGSSHVTSPKGSVLLLHGIRSDRRSMLGRARFLRDAGYHTLCLDLQAHGESPGHKITCGHLESRDAAAGVAYLCEHFPRLPVAVIGTSLGAASALMASYETPPAAIVSESAFSNARTAIANRFQVRFGFLGRRFLTPVLASQASSQLGTNLNSLSPASKARDYSGALFVLNGTADLHAMPIEAQEIHRQARTDQKELWLIEGAAHVDLHLHAGATYETRILQFLDAALTRPQ